MDDESLVRSLQRSAQPSAAAVSQWSQLSLLLAALEAIGREGVIVIIKVDGARPGDSIYTVVLSGGPLGEAFFRKDGASLPDLVREAIGFYAAAR